jgi:hypothetical protein
MAGGGSVLAAAAQARTQPNWRFRLDVAACKVKCKITCRIGE